MLKNCLFFCLFLALFSCKGGYAQGLYGRQIGFGGILGDPNGVTIKYWLNGDNALSFSGGYAYFGDPRLGADFLWNFKIFNIKFLRLYAGPGIVLGFGNGDGIFYKKSKDKFYYREEKENGAGLRGVGGVLLLVKEIPAEIFLETGLLYGIFPKTGFAVDAALGVRYYP